MARHILLLLSTLLLLTAVASAETVEVKYRGRVDLAPFECDAFTRRSVVTRICYDTEEEYLLVSLQGIYYHYCEVPGRILVAWRGAASMGRFYQQRVRGQYDCRVNHMPTYTR